MNDLKGKKLLPDTAVLALSRIQGECESWVVRRVPRPLLNFEPRWNPGLDQRIGRVYRARPCASGQSGVLRVRRGPS